jgi:UDP-2,3-diacylglucosamine hydrolase
VKVAKPQQDMRFDVPTVGPSTIQSIRAAGGKVLAIEAGKTILIDEAETVRLANEAGITIISRE